MPSLRRIFAAALIALLFAGQAAWTGSTISFVSASIVISPITGTTFTITPSPGQFIVANTVSNRAVGDTTITSNNTWVHATSCANSTVSQISFDYVARAVGGADPVVITSAAGAGTSIRTGFSYFTGVNSTAPLDVIASCATQGPGTTFTSPTLTPSTRFVVSLVGFSCVPIVTISSPTNGYFVQSYGGNIVTMAKAQLTDIGGSTTNTTATSNVSTTCAMAMLSFKPAYVNNPLPPLALRSLWEWVRGVVLATPS